MEYLCWIYKDLFYGFIGQASQSPHLSFRMIAIERKLLEMSGQVSQVLEGMDKLNVKVESSMQQLLACREDGVNVRNLKTIVATINIKEVDATARTRSLEILGVAIHLDFDGLGLGTIMVESVTLSTQLTPKAHHISTGKGVG